MRKFRQRIKEIEKSYLARKNDYDAYMLANIIFIVSIFLILQIIASVLHIIFKPVGLCMIITTIILLVVFLFFDTAFFIALRASFPIVKRIFGKYGNVVRKADWKLIRKFKKSNYKYILGKASKGQCYLTSWMLALWIEDAKIMYCIVRYKDGRMMGHAVVVKNNCVYDTNVKQHYDFDYYLKMSEAEVYQIYEKETYATKTFFEDIRQGFRKWCKERDAHCEF